MLTRLLTNIWKVFEHRALHGQLIEVCIQQREDPIRMRTVCGLHGSNFHYALRNSRGFGLNTF